ncbi:hypothetical protein CY34DRAFT_13230 [Suillus luteus UH-Slu-Lm8-n1]|uniref:Uncharacterized protein n=1 Tax=Suillus luteus UH-Slu-Lm8-n1 TaxID=930992 RepID=A0A0C9ZTA6_9AGAM|nr:hypothetical protein CY34DRAFT_13230 [Suillus luteus UH-Slu-Lm8-n1]
MSTALVATHSAHGRLPRPFTFRENFAGLFRPTETFTIFATATLMTFTTFTTFTTLTALHDFHDFHDLNDLFMTLHDPTEILHQPSRPLRLVNTSITLHVLRPV